MLLLVVHQEPTMKRSVHSVMTVHMALQPKTGSMQAPSGDASTIIIEIFDDNSNNNKKHR